MDHFIAQLKKAQNSKVHRYLENIELDIKNKILSSASAGFTKLIYSFRPEDRAYMQSDICDYFINNEFDIYIMSKICYANKERMKIIQTTSKLLKLR